MPDAASGQGETALRDSLIKSFLEHLTTERGASPYTLRNYQQALAEATHGITRIGNRRCHGQGSPARSKTPANV